ncbi:glycoside hydrolase [Streptomyces wuyuanensis]|uniref:GH39 family glycosyl hydrolase n=1 Tax=Streptomyces wuyuanensis TaxID=1196353 RepID=UPI00371BC8C0
MITTPTAPIGGKGPVSCPDDGPLTGTLALPAPTGLHSQDGTGHVLLDWDPVDGALGYVVHRSDSVDGPFAPLDHGGDDMPVVPHPPYADTRVEAGRGHWYKVASWTGAGPGPLTPGPVRGCARARGIGPAAVEVRVDAGAAPVPLRGVWKRTIGSGHLPLPPDGGPAHGGTDTAAEHAEALRIVLGGIGIRTVRTHGTFQPERVTVLADGTFDFTELDAALDRLLAAGLEPVVELSYPPEDIAADPGTTVLKRGGTSTRPEPGRYRGLCRELTVHLCERHGADEVSGWLFEVPDEPGPEVLRTGSQDAFHRRYETAARAVKGVDDRIRVGGHSSGAAAWVGSLLEFCRRADVPIDFVSARSRGNAPLDLRPLTRSFARATGRPEPEVLWTERAVTARHFHPADDSAFAAPSVLRAVKSALASADAFTSWVATDRMARADPPPALFHGGPGLLTAGNLRKPRFWALRLLSGLAGGRVPARVTGDGAEALVEALATAAGDGTHADVLVWNGTPDRTRAAGAAALDRTALVEVRGLTPDAVYDVTLWRVDEGHADIRTVWEAMGGGDRPDARQWARLRAADVLPAEPLPAVSAGPDGTVSLSVDLPMPGVRSLRLTRA